MTSSLFMCLLLGKVQDFSLFLSDSPSFPPSCSLSRRCNCQLATGVKHEQGCTAIHEYLIIKGFISIRIQPERRPTSPTLTCPWSDQTAPRSGLTTNRGADAREVRLSQGRSTSPIKNRGFLQLWRTAEPPAGLQNGPKQRKWPLVFREQTTCDLWAVCSLFFGVFRVTSDCDESLKWPVAVADGSISFTEIVRINRSHDEIFIANPRDQ